MTAPIILIEAQPARANDGVGQIVRFAGGGADKPYRYDNQDWRAGIVALPTIIAQLNVEEGDYGTGAVPKALQIDWAPARNADLTAMAAFFWKDAPVIVRIGPEGALPGVTVVGKVIDDQVEKGVLRLALADPAADLKKPVLTTRYAGTGDLEGPTEWAGKIKPRLWGRVWNRAVEPIDKANNIYAVADPSRPLQAIDAVRDKGAAAAAISGLGWQGSMAATLAALRAAAAPAGGCVVAPSIACLKWWTQPELLHVDVRGETAGGYVETAASVASRVVAAVGGPAFVAGTVAAADAIRTDPVGWLVDDDNMTAAQAIDALLGDVSLLWVLDATGSIIIRPWVWGASVASAVSQAVERKSVFRPVATTKIGYKRNESPIPRGSLAAIVLAGDVTYADGTPVEALKPAEAGATLGARAGSNLVDSGGASLGDNAIKNLAISISASGALAGAGGGQVTISGLGYVGDLGATSGDNMIRNATLASNATDWVVSYGTAARQTSTTAGDQPAFFRCSGVVGGSGANLIALNGGGTGASAIPIRPGARLFFSWLARADVLNTGAGVDRRYCLLRLTYYSASGGGLGTFDVSDQSKASAFVEAGGCGPNWDLHRAYHDAPANAVAVKVELFPIIGTPAAGRYIDLAKPIMGQAQAGADQTYDQLLFYQVQPRATVGENLCRNGDFSNGADGWWLKNTGGWATSELAWRAGAAEGVPGWLRHTPAGNTTRATYHPTRYDRASPFHVDDGMPVIPGREVYLQFAYRSDGTINFGVDAWFYTSGGTAISVGTAFSGGVLNGGGAFSGNTSGAVTRSGICKVTVPAGANLMFLRITMGRPGGSTATYGEMGLFTLNAAEPGATVGARAGSNLVDSAGASLGDNAIKNLAISIGANGALSGAGGGQVTIGGLGYGGALDATRNTVTYAAAAPGSPANGDVWVDTSAATPVVKLRANGVWQTGIQTGADITSLAQVVVSPPPAQTIFRDWQGTPKSGQLPRTITPGVTRGGASIRTDNATSHSITTTGVTATIENTNGSADKGRITLTAGGPGSISHSFTHNGVSYGPFVIAVAVEDDAPPSNGGGGGGSDATLEDVTGTGFTQMTSADAGETIFTATITAGQSLVGTAPLTYNWTHNSASGANQLAAKWQYRVAGSGGAWTDFAAAIVGSDATWSAIDLSGEAGSVNVNQTKSGLGAGSYECRLVGAKNSSSGNAITIATGTATLSVS
ncbi:MAG: hypothetical protein IT472_08810 [Thermomonas sp.]|uniref:hypothetical protein n=1 Tax=Thermomonas sp. TaxID=1971895 RepID=UPI00261A1C38|nr:hypothetical protein [Thermomonas sp.]MCC7097265.1 hypothetical protein [Thermomonas sp.]